MALLGNYSVLTKNALRYRTGTTLFGERSNWQQNGPMRNIQLQDGATTALSKYSKPDGYYPNYTWMLAQVAGSLSVNFQGIGGTGTITTPGNLAAGMYIDGSLTGDGDISLSALLGAGIITAALSGDGDITDVDMSALLTLVAALTGTGDITDAALSAAINASASLTGSGDITSAALLGALFAVASLTSSGDISSANLSAALSAVASLTGSGDVSDALFTASIAFSAALSGSGDAVADILAKGWMPADLTGTATSNNTLSATGNPSASITSFSELSPESLSLAVWNQLQSQFTTPGTMGYALVQALGAGGALTSDQATQLAEVWKIMGLDPANPMSVSSTERTVDEIAQTFTGTDTVVVTRT